MANGATLQINQLTKAFGEHEVLKGIDLELNSGQFVSLMGASGSGKSTLLNIVGAMIPGTSGDILIEEQSLLDLNDNELAEIRRHKVGWVFQDFLLVEGLTALENVLVPMNLAGINGPEAEARASELLHLVGLGDRMDHFPAQLSGGQQQRVALARSLANDPGIILADEPTGNLDTRTGEQIVEIFQNLAKQGKAILMVSHDIKLAHAAQKVYILKNGVVHEELEDEVELI